METINKEYLEHYKDEARELFHQRVFAILWVGILLIPLFSILDFVIVPDVAKRFLVYRIACSILLFGILGLQYWETSKTHPFAIALVAYIISGVTMALMIVNLGGYASYYYVGILLVLVAFSAILPLNVLQSFFSGILLYLIYVIPVLVYNEPDPESVKMFFNNCFFFLAFIIITTIQCNEETKGRIREFNLKIDLNSANEQLKYYANNLELEVDKRAKELEESELRYRELYENIIDIVILVDRDNKILMTNPRFFITVGISDVKEIGDNFIRVVHPEDVAIVRKNLLGRLENDAFVKDIQFRLVDIYGKVFDVECNAKALKKNNESVGYQMVIRDITQRKKLERKVVESTQNVQNARTATILGLAKLAEYRDYDTGVHLERMREYTRIIAKDLARKPKYKNYITKDYIDDIYLSSVLHDIGKVGVPDAILLKSGKLTSQEFDVAKRHALLGGDALRAIDRQVGGKSFLTLGKEIAYHHHERWDGTGYPKGLKGEQIPLSARMVALADVYDALTSKRAYKVAFSHEKSRKIILEENGKYFDPDIVDAFLTNEEEFNRIRKLMHYEDEEHPPEPINLLRSS